MRQERTQRKKKEKEKIALLNRIDLKSKKIIPINKFRGFDKDILDLLHKYFLPHPNPPLERGGN
jgi:hypothetical protein